MRSPAESEAVHVLEGPMPARPRFPPWLALLALVVALAIAVAVLSRLSATEVPVDPEPIDAVQRLRDAVAAGEQSEVLAALTEDAVLTWPAGPPWGGPLSGSVELVTDPASAQILDHVAQLSDFLAFQRTLNAETRLRRCNVYSEADGPVAEFVDVWVRCDFSIHNDLLELLADEGVVPFGQMRFRISEDLVSVVLVETWEVRYSPIEFLTWIREQRPAVYESLLGGRMTLPNYGADSAADLVELASEYAAAH